MINNTNELLKRYKEAGIEAKLWKDRIYFQDEQTEYGTCKVYIDLYKEILETRIQYQPKYSLKEISLEEAIVRNKHKELTKHIYNPTDLTGEF
jgi:hypothetical protein